MNSQFNAIDYAQQLEAAGVPQSQAEVHAKMLSSAVSTFAATRADLQTLDEKLTARMDLFEQRMTARMDAFEARITARIDSFESGVRLELAAMHTEIAEMKQTLKFHNWMFGINSALLIALLVKTYFP